MKIILLFISSIVFITNIFSQPGQKEFVTLNIIEELYIDSLIEYNSNILKKTDEFNTYKNSFLNNPITAIQSFVFFNTASWAKSIISDDYSSTYPTQTLIDFRNSKDYMENAFLQMHFILYFHTNNNQFATIFANYYGGEISNNVYNAISLKYQNDKWLLTSDSFITQMDLLTIFKKEYAINILSGDSKDKDVIELSKEFVNEGVLNIEKLKEFIESLKKQEIERKYSKIINKESSAYIFRVDS